MICYRDITFCASDCTNTACHRHFSEETQKMADKWWGKGELAAPVAFSNFRPNCDDYVEPTLAERG